MPNFVPGSLLVLQRLKRHTTVINGHWIYTGLDKSGYGRIKIKGQKYSTIRLSLSIHLGLDYHNWEWQANHKDDECKEHACWNPAHLYAGTHSQNMLDSVRSGTHHEAKKTHCNIGHLLDGKRKNGKRYCSECNRERMRKKNAKLR